jgi:uridine phosphorylase
MAEAARAPHEPPSQRRSSFACSGDATGRSLYRPLTGVLGVEIISSRYAAECLSLASPADITNQASRSWVRILSLQPSPPSNVLDPRGYASHIEIISEMPFPNLEGKHSYEAFFSPRDFLDYLKRHGLWEDFPLPNGVIFVYSPRLFERIMSRETGERHGRFAGEFYLIKRSHATIGLSGRFGIGPAAVSTIMEELIAIGIAKFLSIGAAGGLQKDLRIGDIVVCDRAIRDEGVSHHYLEPDKYAYPSPTLTGRFIAELESLGSSVRVGTTWTTDAPYRETVEELTKYQSEGVLTVEMEAAALAAVARYRKVDFATAFTISDSLAELVWNPQFGSEDTSRGLDRLYDAAVAALA